MRVCPYRKSTRATMSPLTVSSVTVAVSVSVTMRPETDSSTVTCATSRSSGSTSDTSCSPSGSVNRQRETPSLLRNGISAFCCAAESPITRPSISTNCPSRVSFTHSGGRRLSSSSSLPAARSVNAAGTLAAWMPRMVLVSPSTTSWNTLCASIWNTRRSWSLVRGSCRSRSTGLPNCCTCALMYCVSRRYSMVLDKNSGRFLAAAFAIFIV